MYYMMRLWLYLQYEKQKRGSEKQKQVSWEPEIIIKKRNGKKKYNRKNIKKKQMHVQTYIFNIT
jgi:hypothetical protein